MDLSIVELTTRIIKKNLRHFNRIQLTQVHKSTNFELRWRGLDRLIRLLAWLYTPSNQYYLLQRKSNPTIPKA